MLSAWDLLALVIHVSSASRETEVTHPHVHTASFTHTHTHTVLHLPGQHMDTCNGFHHKICTSAAQSHSHPDTQNIHPSAKEQAAPHCPKILIHIFKAHFSGGPRPCWAKCTSSPHKSPVKLAALLTSTLNEHSLLVTLDTS